MWVDSLQAGRELHHRAISVMERQGSVQDAGCWFHGTPALPASSHRVAEAVHVKELLTPAAGGRNPRNLTSGNVLLTSCGIVESLQGATFACAPLCALSALQLLLAGT